MPRAPDRRQPAAHHRSGHRDGRRGAAEHRAAWPPGSCGRTSSRAGSGSDGRAPPRTRPRPNRPQLDEQLAAHAAGGGSAHRRPGQPATTRASRTGCSGPSSTTCWIRFRSTSRDWDGYVEANERFADVVAAHYQPGDLIWVHDYQLFLLPGPAARSGCPDARIGFFLHIPFPSEELFRTLPERGPPAAGPARRRSGRLPYAGVSPALRRIAHRHPRATPSRSTGSSSPTGKSGSASFRWGSTPQAFAALADDPAVQARSRGPPGRRKRAAPGGRRSAGLHQGHPSPAALLREDAADPSRTCGRRVRLVQVAVPSRTGVGAYQDFRALVDGLVGRINGDFGTPRWVPVHYIYRALSERRAGGAVPRGRRHAGDPAARRDEPGGQGVRRLPYRWRRRAGAE